MTLLRLIRLCVCFCQLDLLRLYDTAEMTATGTEQLRRAHRALELAGAPRDPPARSAAAGSPHQPATGPRRGVLSRRVGTSISPISPKAQKRTTVSPPRALPREPPQCPQQTIVQPNGEAEAAPAPAPAAAAAAGTAAARLDCLQRALESAAAFAAEGDSAALPGSGLAEDFPDHLVPYALEVSSACTKLGSELRWLRLCAAMVALPDDAADSDQPAHLVHRIWT